MHKILALGLSVVLLCCLWGCSSGGDGLQTGDVAELEHKIADLEKENQRLQNESTSSNSGNQTGGDFVVQFADPVFEQLVRGAMQKMSGDIYQSELARFTGIRIYTAYGECSLKLCDDYKYEHENMNGTLYTWNGLHYGIQAKREAPDYKIDPDYKDIISYEDLKYFSGLKGLDINGGCPSINNMSFIKAMPDLQELKISDCAANDLSPIAALKNIEVIELDGDYKLSSLEVFSNLTTLKKLLLYNFEEGTDVSPIQNLIDNGLELGGSAAAAMY